MFAVIRHPDVAVPGICPEEAIDTHRARGWYRVSEWRAEPGEFHLADYADATEDLDAAEPEDEDPPADDEAEQADAPKPKTARRPARTTKKESNA